eukprot:TRINITY_DN214_c0_g1_i1.p1 TRINITY_DN214_c0_g1~~TRINITY_DN214_c0_g1_i1.p1  ORF type:complete len:191 (+),score=46.04 TRINITY_DN214_c0_g1_i1:181-753(+)
MSKFFVASLLLVQALIVSGNKLHSSPVEKLSTDASSTAPVDAKSNTAKSWMSKFMLAFGAPHEDAIMSLQAEGAKTEDSFKSLRSKFSLAFGAPKFIQKEESSLSSISQRIHEAVQSLLAIKGPAGNVKAPEELDKVTGKGKKLDNKYNMGLGWRVYYEVTCVILILITIVAFAWLIKETPGNGDVASSE